MQAVRIAGAQSISVAGDITANVLTHLRFIAAAHRAQAHMLVFPELSLCGYELPLLRQCLLHPEDSRLQPIRAQATATGMTIVVGAAVASPVAEAPAIGAISYHRDGSYSVYHKQYLHPGEELYATQGHGAGGTSDLCGRAYALAICADTVHEAHAAHAARLGAGLYLAGVLVSEGGYAADSAKMQHYAADFAMGVLMVNHGGPSGRYVSAGKSSFWAPGGQLVVQTPGVGNALLVVSLDTAGWQGEVQSLEGASA